MSNKKDAEILNDLADWFESVPKHENGYAKEVEHLRRIAANLTPASVEQPKQDGKKLVGDIIASIEQFGDIPDKLMDKAKIFLKEPEQPSEGQDAKLETAKRLIDELYETEDGGVGGYGHIVFDDNNIEDPNIDFCLEEAKRGAYQLSDECRQASIKALEFFKTLTEEDREKVLGIEDEPEKKHFKKVESIKIPQLDAILQEKLLKELFDCFLDFTAAKDDWKDKFVIHRKGSGPSVDGELLEALKKLIQDRYVGNTPFPMVPQSEIEELIARHESNEK